MSPGARDTARASQAALAATSAAMHSDIANRNDLIAPSPSEGGSYVRGTEERHGDRVPEAAPPSGGFNPSTAEPTVSGRVKSRDGSTRRFVGEERRHLCQNDPIDSSCASLGA